MAADATLVCRFATWKTEADIGKKNESFQLLDSRYYLVFGNNLEMIVDAEGKILDVFDWSKGTTFAEKWEALPPKVEERFVFTDVENFFQNMSLPVVTSTLVRKMGGWYDMAAWGSDYKEDDDDDYAWLSERDLVKNNYTFFRNESDKRFLATEDRKCDQHGIFFLAHMRPYNCQECIAAALDAYASVRELDLFKVMYLEAVIVVDDGPKKTYKHNHTWEPYAWSNRFGQEILYSERCKNVICKARRRIKNLPFIDIDMVRHVEAPNALPS